MCTGTPLQKSYEKGDVLTGIIVESHFHCGKLLSFILEIVNPHSAIQTFVIFLTKAHRVTNTWHVENSQGYRIEGLI